MWGSPVGRWVGGRRRSWRRTESRRNGKSEQALGGPVCLFAAIIILRHPGHSALNIIMVLSMLSFPPDPSLSVYLPATKFSSSTFSNKAKSLRGFRYSPLIHRKSTTGFNRCFAQSTTVTSSTRRVPILHNNNQASLLSLLLYLPQIPLLYIYQPSPCFLSTPDPPFRSHPCPSATLP